MGLSTSSPIICFNIKICAYQVKYWYFTSNWNVLPWLMLSIFYYIFLVISSVNCLYLLLPIFSFFSFLTAGTPYIMDINPLFVLYLCKYFLLTCLIILNFVFGLYRYFYMQLNLLSIRTSALYMCYRRVGSLLWKSF